VVELGCGWGCWLNFTGVAARRQGKRVFLIGVEGDVHHAAFAHEALSANGFTPDDYRIVHGVAAARRGKALFPLVDQPGATWGSTPVIDATEAQLEEAATSGGYAILEAYPLEEIAGGQQIDLLHIDIQGGEADLIEAALDGLTRSVRYLLVGTHSRDIEGRIMAAMARAGWALEVERPAIYRIDDGRAVLQVDGVLAYRNPHNRSP
jgi:hypothetical protein